MLSSTGIRDRDCGLVLLQEAVIHVVKAKFEGHNIVVVSIGLLGLGRLWLCEDYAGAGMSQRQTIGHRSLKLTHFALILLAFSSVFALTEMTAVKVPPS